MDDDSLRNWGYYEPPIRNNLGFHLMSSVTERDTKPFLTNREDPVMASTNGTYHHQGNRPLTEQPITHLDYVQDSWINQRERFLHMFPGNPYNNNPLIGESSNAHHHPMQMMPQPVQNEETSPIAEEPVSKKATGPTKKRAASSASTNPKAPKGKKPRKAPTLKENGNYDNNNDSSTSSHRAKTAKKNVEVVINGVDYDISSIPIPVCSCTGNPQQCYRWGCGGWQSACCTTTISTYPLPMSTKRRGARIAGRKMSQGAFKKVLEKLATEGYDFANPIDLRTYWAKHGTNKFVVIR